MDAAVSSEVCDIAIDDIGCIAFVLPDAIKFKDYFGNTASPVLSCQMI